MYIPLQCSLQTQSACECKITYLYTGPIPTPLPTSPPVELGMCTHTQAHHISRELFCNKQNTAAVDLL